MAELAAHGLHVDAPSGWEGRIFRRAEAGDIQVEGVVGAAAPAGERTFAVVHVATIPLPLDIADYGSDVVEDLGRNDALIVLKEFDPADAHQPLFRRAGMPRALHHNSFRPDSLQRRLEGQAGYQAFFHENGRAFCLYVVLGDYGRRRQVVPRVNAVLATMQVESPNSGGAAAEGTETSTTTTTTQPTTTSTAPTTAPTEPASTTTAPTGPVPDPGSPPSSALTNPSP